MAEPNRPLSPHLQVYKFEITMAMSIVHRITGTGLYFGTALIAWWFAAAAIGDGRAGLFQSLVRSTDFDRLYLGFVPSHAWRSSPLRLGHG